MINYVDIHTHRVQPWVFSPTMAGVHPWDAEHIATLPDLSTCDIVGETGLDYVCGVDRAKQMALFTEHLAQAERLGKPVVLHVVKAFEDVMRTLDNYRDIEGVLFHGFIGSKEQAQRCIDRGYYLSFGVRSLRSPRTRQVIAMLPKELLFIETDDSPKPTIKELYRLVAEIRQEEVEQLARQIYNNCKRLIKNNG